MPKKLLIPGGWFGRGRIRALLCLATIGALAFTTSAAFWTDEVQVSGTTFTSGTLNLVVNDADPYGGATQLSMSGMVPGNTSAQVLTVKNAGNVPAKYTLAGGLTGTNAADFAAAGANGLQLTIVLGGAKSGTGNTSTCTGGSVVYGPTALTANTTTALLTKRPTTALAPNGNGTEALCFQVSFAAAAPTDLQGKTADAVFTATGTSDVS